MREVYADYDKAQASLANLATSPMQETTRQRLERQKRGLELTLEDVNRALKMLEENPKFEEFHEAMRRV